MKGLDILHLLWVTKTLTSLLCGAENSTVLPPHTFNQTFEGANSTNLTSEATPLTTSGTPVSTVSYVQSTTRPITSGNPTSIRIPDSSVPNQNSYRQQCLPFLMISGGLILAVAILLISTLLLTWKVCQLSNRIKTLSSDGDLISNSEYWMGSAHRRKHRPSADARENVLLLDQIRMPKEEVIHDATKEENGPEVEKKKEEKAASDEASETPGEKEANRTQSEKREAKLPEVATPQSAETTAATSSEGGKDVA